MKSSSALARLPRSCPLEVNGPPVLLGYSNSDVAAMMTRLARLLALVGLVHVPGLRQRLFDLCSPSAPLSTILVGTIAPSA